MRDKERVRDGAIDRSADPSLVADVASDLLTPWCKLFFQEESPTAVR